MAQISQIKVTTILHKCDNGATAEERGKAFEDLVKYLFSRIPGMKYNQQDRIDYSNTQEIDLAFWNDKLSFLPYVILIECKNWKDPIGSPEVIVFKEKLNSRGLEFGIIVATNGLTGNTADRNAAHNVISSALQQKLRIIVFNKEDLLSFTSTTDIVETIKMKLLDLAVIRT
jgi:restriction endonuclease Mrr